MPRLLLLLAFLLALPAVAQDVSPVVVNRAELDPHLFNAGQGLPPDTISPWRYYPLAVGNAWEYQNVNGETMRIDIRRDSVIDNQVYYNWHRMWYTAQGAPQPAWEVDAYIRFDTTTTYVVTSGVIFPYFPWIRCRFDAQPGKDLECEGNFGGLVTFMTYEGVLVFSDTTVTDVAVKEYDTVGGAFRYGADFGEVWAWEKDGRPIRGLTFARIDGQEFGSENYPLSGEPQPAEPSAMAIEAAWPNPVRFNLSVRIHVPAPGPVRVSVYDMLGREVLTREHVAEHWQSTVQLDLAILPPGAYIVRATAAHGTTRGVRFVRVR